MPRLRSGFLSMLIATLGLASTVVAAPASSSTGPPVIRPTPPPIGPHHEHPLAARGATVTRNTAIFTLASTFVITTATTTRTFDWTLSTATGAPDGYQREMMVINGQYPGPLIEANEGDTIVVNVQNNLPTGNGIHWHGMLQQGTNWADGVPGFSQCPIPAGKSFQYKFKLTGQQGSYWYHSHQGNTMADGIMGPLVIHSPSDPLVRGRDYTYEQLIMLGDWMHDPSELIVADLLGPTGYRGTFAAPVPDSLLLNGAGVYDCSDTTDPCTTKTIPEVPVVPNSKYRFRIVNHGSHVHFKFSIDNHPLTVVAADGNPIVAVNNVHQLPIGVGQRYDVVVNTNVGSAGQAFFMRAAICSAALAGVPADYNIFALGAFRYVAPGTAPSTTAPTSSDWSDSTNNDATCQDFPDANLVPLITNNAPSSALDSVVLSSAAGTMTDSAGDTVVRFFWNSVTWSNYIYQPLLFKIQAGQSIDDSIITHHIFTGNGGGDIVINNLDGFLDHPYHLHGNPFYIIARGPGALTSTTYPSTAVTTHNPPQRDTITIPRSSWAILRIVTNDPGVWPLHCHIGWHLAGGKMAAIIVQPNSIATQVTPTAATQLCAASNIPAGDTVDTLAPGRKRAVHGLNPPPVRAYMSPNIRGYFQ